MSDDNDKVKICVMPTEIYSRVVGYYRPVQAWNTGKQEEFKERNNLVFSLEDE